MINEIFNIQGIHIIRPTYTDNIELFVKGDYNDGDYVSETHFISIDEFELLLPIIRKVLNYDGECNWKGYDMDYNTDYLTNEEINVLYKYIPSSTEYEVHTIEEIVAWYLCSDAIRYEIKIV